MYKIDLNELFALNRNGLLGISLSVLLYNALNITNDPEKREVIKSTALLLLVYSLVSVAIFNTIFLIQFYYTKSNIHIIAYSLLSLVMIAVIVYMVFNLLNL